MCDVAQAWLKHRGTHPLLSSHLLQHFGLEAGLELTVKKRGAPPTGGGMVLFTCPVVRQLHAMQLTDPGFVKRIRGTAYTTRVSPTTANRVVDSVRCVPPSALAPAFYLHPKRSC